MRERTVRAGEEELFKSRAREQGSVKLIDLITARLDAATDSYLATLPSLQPDDVRIDADMVAEQRTHADRRLLRRDHSSSTTRPSPRRRTAGPSASALLRPIQLSKRGVLDELAARPRSVHDRGVEGTSCCAASASSRSSSPRRAQDVLLLRMVPFVERNYNMVELGPRGTGKSHLFQQVSPYSHLVSGGKATVARMFVNNATGQRGLVCQYDVVCFDEISGVSFDQKDGVNIMKGYMESGRVQPRPGEHPRRRQHRPGGQLRRRRRAPAAHRPPVRPAAAGDARRHRLHGPHPCLSARLGRAEDGQPGSSPTTSAWSATSSPSAGRSCAARIGLAALQGRVTLRRRTQRPRHHGGQQHGQRPAEAALSRPRAWRSPTRTWNGRCAWRWSAGAG